MIVIIDSKIANVGSVSAAFRRLDEQVIVSGDPAVVSSASGLLLPGVGAFGDGMNELHIRGMSEAIKACVKMGIPVLGICLGMQLFMAHGEEFGIHQGMGLISGNVTRLTNIDQESEKVKVPHIGWNKILFPNGNNGDHVDQHYSDLWENEVILRDISQGSFMYFVHSFVVIPDDQDLKVAETSYGASRFCSIIRKDNLVGCQFHPERSGVHGLKIYQNFIHLIYFVFSPMNQKAQAKGVFKILGIKSKSDKSLLIFNRPVKAE